MMPQCYALCAFICLLILPRGSFGGEADYISVFPSVQQYLRRNTPRTTIVGNYLYIDGGDISFLDPDGVLREPIQKCVNATLSIDISKSWNTKDVKIKSIPKIAPSLTGQSIASDLNKNTFYIWGGNSGLDEERRKVSKSSQWVFAADDDGGGSWFQDAPSNRDLLKSFAIPQDGAYATAKDTLFFVGGIATGWTEPGRVYTQPIPGVLSFNMSTKTWRNDTAADLSTFGTLNMGAAQFVPKFGPNGIILILGGATTSLAPSSSEPIGTQSFSILKFFDPVTKVWYSQNTSGDIPMPRTRPCSVGVEDRESGTYEIFIFGGTDRINKQIFEDVYVLSLPGFVWHKVETNSGGGGRSGHSCIVIGKRQMLSVGGVDDHDGFTPTLWSTPDPFPNGMAIMDLTNLSWSGVYNANADEYKSPDFIRDWYDKGNQASVTWSSKEVEQLFATDNEKAPIPSAPINPNSHQPEEPKSSISTVAIIGAVIGSVCAMVIVAGITFIALKRRTKQRALLPLNSGSGPHEVHGQYVTPTYQELGVDQQSLELQGTTVLNSQDLLIAKEVP